MGIVLPRIASMVDIKNAVSSIFDSPKPKKTLKRLKSKTKCEALPDIDKPMSYAAALIVASNYETPKKTLQDMTSLKG